jgi:hypothetical protein
MRDTSHFWCPFPTPASKALQISHFEVGRQNALKIAIQIAKAS